VIVEPQIVAADFQSAGSNGRLKLGRRNGGSW